LPLELVVVRLAPRDIGPVASTSGLPAVGARDVARNLEVFRESRMRGQHRPKRDLFGVVQEVIGEQPD
jgi:hypothetical protein